MNNDEIVSNIISLIHSTTQSNYVICSQVSSKIFSFLSQTQIQDYQWKELNQAIERFDQSLDHPDLQQFQQLIQIISRCSNDSEERNYTLGRDKNTFINSINQLRDLLKSHVNLRCFLLTKSIEQQEIRLQLIDLMNLTGMDFENEVYEILFDIVHLLCQIDTTFARSIVIDHSIVLNAIRIIQYKTVDEKLKLTIISALNLLADLVVTGQPFPVETNSQLSNYVFLKSVFELIENNRQNDDIVMSSIKFLLSFNLRFDYPSDNPIILTLVTIHDDVSCQELIERLILLFNRNIDPVKHQTTNSIVKFFADLFGDEEYAYFSESDRRLIIEIISRELSNHSYTDKITTSYLSLLELILRNQTITSETCTRINELQTCFQSYLSFENCLDENRYIIYEIIRQHNCLTLNDIKS